MFQYLFQQADTEKLGVITGEIAVKFFERTKLAPAVLGEIWQIADTENRGLLTMAGFCQVLRLIGHYQAGRDPSPELAYRRTFYWEHSREDMLMYIQLHRSPSSKASQYRLHQLQLQASPPRRQDLFNLRSAVRGLSACLRSSLPKPLSMLACSRSQVPSMACYLVE